jgi:AraC-like DNA-binding protein
VAQARKIKNKLSHAKSVPDPLPAPGTPFAEAPAWQSVGRGWRPLFGNYRDLGFSFEWHEFNVLKELDWAKSFHPGSIELCMNLEGHGKLINAEKTVELVPQTFAFYYQSKPSLQATRAAGGPHRFITIEFSPAFFREHFSKQVDNLHPLIRGIVRGETGASEVTSAERLSSTLQQLVENLRNCPVFSPAQEMWFRSKALEVAAHLFFQPASGEMFCTRAQRLARERVAQAKLILQERLHEPPSLEELSRLVHCSPFYLSRLFTQEGGVTMQQFLRRARMERAAELLRTGQCNVTEAALEVGYNSLSHFSTTFHETFGCCPGLYPLKTPSQRNANEE